MAPRSKEAPWGWAPDGTPLGRYGEDPRHFDPAVFEPILAVLDPLLGPTGPWPTEERGLDAVPEPPVLLVGNHSGGVMIPDGWALGWTWYRRYPERALAALGHFAIFVPPGINRFFARVGALRAEPEAALRMLRDHGRDVVVMPGGDRDTYRPYRDAFKVCFDGRTGYARLALRADVPIVPVANSGAHATMFILRRGGRLARAMGLRALRAEVWPLMLSIPWGLSLGPVPYVPLPVRIRLRYGAPVALPSTFRQRFAHGEPTREAVEELDRLTRGAMQGMLDALREETPTFRERLRFGLRT